MLKARRSSEEPAPNRVKLPVEAGIRPLSGIKDLLAEAESSRGKRIELAWTTNKPDQTYVLNVQWDINSDPIWSLYEENTEESKKLWTESFPAEDIELFYDVLVMSCGANTTPTHKLSEILKAQSQDKDNQKQSKTRGTDKQQDKNSQSEHKDDYSLNINPEPDANVEANNQSAASTKATETSNPAGMPGYPGYSGQPGTAIPIAFPPPPYTMPAGPMPPSFPFSYPPGMDHEQAFFLQPMPPPGWVFAPKTVDNKSGSDPSTFPGNPYTQDIQGMQSTTSTTRGSLAEPLSAMPIDNALLKKSSDISLADLLKQAELLTEPALAAALKIQDMVQDGRLAVDKAAEILKQYSQMGESIEDYVDSTSLPTSLPAASEDVHAGKFKSSAAEVSAAFELLEKSGLLTKDDIGAAKNVARKHGGDVISILKAANKLDGKTLDASLTCASLLERGLMKLEQCVIALNYCSRSRVGFDEALTELGWEIPKTT